VKMVATDGHRLSLVAKKREGIEGEGTLEALIPRKAVTEALKMLKDEEGEVQLQLFDNQLILKLENSFLTCRLIEGQFPNYQQVIPKGGVKKLLVSREAFQGALKRTSAIIGDRPIPTTFELKPGKLLLSCVNVDLGEAKEELEAEYSGEEMSIGFNTRYILEFLAVVEEDEIQVQLNDSLSPALFRPAGNGGFSCVIMPMRI
ncbi:MAG: DNA polymerase III subunit beta, partial [candidate division NC10 bacterium]|nr:DNA polymerase III subunit beta [candidate division NC10 bacterium]